MMTLRVVPDPLLRRTSQPILRFPPAIGQLANEMASFMVAQRGIGLAAPQIGVLQRLVIVLVDGAPVPIANPIIAAARGQSQLDEGCLSCPGVLVRVRRHALVVVEGQRCDGNQVSYRFDRITAHCIQHEIDHLDGRLILDHGPPLAGRDTA